MFEHFLFDILSFAQAFVSVLKDILNEDEKHTYFYMQCRRNESLAISCFSAVTLIGPISSWQMFLGQEKSCILCC